MNTYTLQIKSKIDNNPKSVATVTAKSLSDANRAVEHFCKFGQSPDYAIVNSLIENKEFWCFVFMAKTKENRRKAFMKKFQKP